MELLDAFLSWAKADIASWHASTAFHIFGWAVDKVLGFIWVSLAVIVLGIGALLLIVMQINKEEAQIVRELNARKSGTTPAPAVTTPPEVVTTPAELTS